MKPFIIEFIGTFFLTTVVAFTGNPFVVGAVLTSLVYMGGYISGAHYNPAVTLGALIAKKIDSQTAIRYVATQFIGAFAAVFFYLIVHKQYFTPLPAAQATIGISVAVETIFTFLLVSVILHTAATKKTANNSYFGLAIGFTLFAIAAAGGPISGGVFNPAIGVGALLFDFPNIASRVWPILLYLIAPSIGGVLASLVYRAK